MQKTIRLTALAGAATAILAAAPAQAHHAYNLDGYTNAATGWSLSGSDGGNPSATPAVVLDPTPGNPATARWASGGPGVNYTGSLEGMWYAAFHSYESHNLSTADALAKTWNHDSDTNTAAVAFGTTHAGFELAVGAKSWEDTVGSGPNEGWGHALDFGLINLDVPGDLSITVSADGSGLLPAFSFYQGWDAGGGMRHDTYVNNANNPLSTTGLTLLQSVANPGAASSVTYTFTNLATGHYSLFVGGDDGAAGGRYTANMTLTAVPIPAAVWLFGSAVMGLLGIGRRQRAE